MGSETTKWYEPTCDELEKLFSGNRIRKEGEAERNRQRTVNEFFEALERLEKETK
jgi:hypothetical protein